MKKILIIFLCSILVNNTFAQVDTPTIKNKLNIDDIDSGVLPNFQCGFYDVYKKYQTKIKKYHRVNYSFKVPFTNSKELMFAYISLNSYLSGVEVVALNSHPKSIYTPIVLTNTNFITNHLKIKIGDSYKSVIDKISALPYFSEKQKNGDDALILKGTCTANFPAIGGDLFYVAKYIFKNKKLYHYTIMFN